MDASFVLRKENKKSAEEEKNVAPSCILCQDKSCLKTGRPCQEIEKLLPKPNHGRLEGEHSFDPYILSLITDEQIARKLLTGGGKQKKAHLPEE